MKKTNHIKIQTVSKTAIRDMISSKRQSLTGKYISEKSITIAEKFFSTNEYKKSKNILAYYPFRNEIDTTAIITGSLNDNKKIILPKVFKKDLKLFYVDNPEEQLSSGSFGIMEPLESKCKTAERDVLDIVIVPGLAFDRNFNRIGYGGGFYDRFLKNIKKSIIKIALCFDFQLLSSVPNTENDIKTDIVITEKKVYYS